jgi:large subunit ribosomal protein L1
MAQHGKRYRQVLGEIDREAVYSPAQAVRILKGADAAKFDETVEVHLNLGLNVRHAEEQLRGTLMLPHGTGREQRVAVFAEGDKAKEAQDAGADIIGSADLAKRVEEGFTDFDVAIATPDQMGNVGKLGRILGPRGLMPNPKTGTVTMDVGKAVREAKAGKLEYRTDRGANVHVPIGKRSFDERQLVENYAALIDEIVRAKPASSRRSRSRARWGPGSTSIPSARAASSRIWRSRRPLQFRLSHTPVATDRWQSCGTEVHPRRPPGRATPPASPPECGLVS